MAAEPVRTGLIAMKRPPARLNLPSAIFIGLLWWSSAVPIITNTFARSRSGPAKSPKPAADGVDHPRRHVDRAQAAMRSIVGRAELAREQAGERLHLVAAGKQRELLRVARADAGQTLGQHVVGALPTDGLELPGPALAAGLAQQRLRDARGRELL